MVPNSPLISTSSSPNNHNNNSTRRPSSISGSELFDETNQELNHQRSADAHLAQSMRTRSINLLDRTTGVSTSVGISSGGSGNNNNNNNNSNNNNIDLMVTPLRDRTALNNIGGGGGNNTSAQRRSSIGNNNNNNNNNNNTRDHLADDLMQDQGYYDSRNLHSAASSSRQQQQSQQLQLQQSAQRPLNPQHPFYRHQRNLSDSSLDGFVDHRRPPVHTLASGGGGNRGIMISGGERNLPDNYGGIRSINRTVRRESSGEVLGLASHRRRSRSRSISPSSRNPLDPSQSIVTVRNTTTAPRQGQGLTSQDLDENAITSEDDDLLHHDHDQDQATRQSPRAYIERHISQTSTHDRHHNNNNNNNNNNLQDEDELDLLGSFGHELSRGGSSLGKPEEDVCFPTHGAVDPDLLDLGLSSMYARQSMAAATSNNLGETGDEEDLLNLHHHHHMNHMNHLHLDDPDHDQLHDQHHHHQGVAGVLSNFPFPFDFGALEEFAEREKEGMPIPAAKKRGGMGGIGGMGGGGSMRTGEGNAPPDYGNASGSKMRNRGNATSGGEQEGGGGGRGKRSMRQRKLSESVAPGRFQRKLAQFEGEGEEGPNESRGGERGGNNAGGGGGGGVGSSNWSSILDSKTPLIGSGGGGGGGGTNNAAKPRGGYGATNGPGAINAAARPYRFSFYSNALPSTIHARSLAEIPAEGQTFEELFVGHQINEYEDEPSHSPSQSQSQSQSGGIGPGGNNNNNINMTDPRMAFSPTSQSQSGAGTGANTPNGNNSHSNQPSLSGQQNQNGARPGGIPQTQGGGNGGGGMREQVRNARMRTEMDTEANTWWLDVLCPTDQEMKVLSKVFGIHPLTTEDIQMEETREKIELFRNYYFVCFRSFEQDPYSPTYLEPLNMYIIVFREGTLSFHFRGTPHPQNVRRRIKQLKDYINVTSDWISYALIDDVIDAFTPLILNIEYEVDSIDELVLILKEAEQSDMLRRIGTCRKKVMGLLRLMGNKGDVVKGLSKRCNENWAVAPKSDIGLYLSDIQDHITTSIQNLTHYEKILSRSHSNYLAQISIEMTDANNQINDVLSKLTALGTVLIPMNLITGLWGMNVHVPGQDVENLHWFFSILGCLGAIAIIGAWLTYRVFVRSA